MTDETTELPTVNKAPAAITETSEAKALAALLDAVDAHAVRIRALAATRDRDGTRERVHGLIADAQRLDAHLAEAERAEREAATEAAFTDWATAPGGER